MGVGGGMDYGGIFSTSIERCPEVCDPKLCISFSVAFFLSLQKNLIRHNLSKNVALIRGQPRSSGRVCVKLGEIEIPLPNQSTKMYFLFR